MLLFAKLLFYFYLLSILLESGQQPFYIMKNYEVLKRFCRKVYLAGSGNFWYEGNETGDDTNMRYKVYRFILFSMYCCMTLLEIMAAVFGVFPKDEKKDSITFAVSHTIVMIKIFSMIFNKERVKMLNRKMITVCEMYEDEALMVQKYRTIKSNVAAYSIVVYATAICFVYEGFRKVKNGSQFVTIVTYWPSFEDDSIEAKAFRILTTCVLFIMMVTMITIDSFAMMYLVVYKYKFISLRYYFERLRENFDKDLVFNETLAANQLTQGVVNGIKMHSELLRLYEDIDQVFGTVLALQVCQSSGSAVSLLLQIALSDDLTFVVAMKTILFVSGLFFLLALFVCNAGEITYQASLLSDSIFYCGWHASAPQPPPQRDLRRLVLVATARAQRPLVIKAFKMLELTYATFIFVVRGTYSVFALFYAQNK